MSDSPIFDQLVAEFAAERKVRYETLTVPAPEFKPFIPRPVEPVQKVVPKPGAVRKSDKPMICTEYLNDMLVMAAPTLQERAESLSDGERLAFFAEVRTLFDKPVKTPYRTEKVEYTGEDTQPIDVTLLRTTKTLQHLE